MQRYAKVLADNPVGHTAGGAMFVLPAALEWQPVAYLEPWDCDHQETMCGTCADTWGIDYEIQLPDGAK